MNNHPPSSGTQTLAGPKHTDNGAWKILYNSYYAPVERFVLSNNGSKDDAKDIFHETIQYLLDNLPIHDIELPSSLKQHINSISSELWLKRLSEEKSAGNIELQEVLSELHDSTNETNIQEAPVKKIRTILDPVSEHCRKLLNLMLFRK